MKIRFYKLVEVIYDAENIQQNKSRNDADYNDFSDLYQPVLMKEYCGDIR
jgi:hypothetical protein